MEKLTILKQETITPPGKNYKVCELGYRTEEGKVKAMKIFGFGPQKEVFDVATKVSPGDIVEAQFSQNDKGYWQFHKLTPTGAKEATDKSVAVPSAPTTRGNWETPEERAARQVMIVRQSSISNAIAFLVALEPKGTSTKTADEVIEVAKRFEHYVLGKPTVTGEVE